LSREVWGLKPEDALFLSLALLAYRLAVEDMGELIARLKVARDDGADLRLLPSLRDTLPGLARARRPSAIYRLLEPYPARVLAVAWLATDSRRLRERLLHYQTEWRLVKPELTGDYLKALGLRPSPLFGRLLGALHDARLDGKVRTREEEEVLLQKLLAVERKRDKEARR
jgi:tRNA nucleotidyltransferase (CCA-adding enzyme)